MKKSGTVDLSTEEDLSIAVAMYGDVSPNDWYARYVHTALAQKILARMHVKLAPDVRAGARHEIQHQWLSAAKARRDLHWAPRFSFDEGLDRTIAWYREFLQRG